MDGVDYNAVALHADATNDGCEFMRLVERVREFFAPPPVELPAHTLERQRQRMAACLRLLEHLRQPDGTLQRAGISIARAAKAIGMKFKWAARALADLIEIGIFGGAGKRPGMFGNRCGHDPERPRWFRPPGHHKRHPGIIELAVTLIREYYAHPKKVFPCLNSIRRRDMKDRLQRSERREACIALLATMLWHMDLETLRVVGWWRGELIGIRIESVDTPEGDHIPGLAELAGLSVSRAEEAMHDLRLAGFVHIHEIAEPNSDGKYRGRPAIKTICKKLFTVLGLDSRLAKEREDARERAEKRREKKRRKAEGPHPANLNMLGNAQRKGQERAQQRQAAAQTAAQHRNKLLFDLMDQFPGRVTEIVELIKKHPEAASFELADMLRSSTGPP